MKYYYIIIIIIVLTIIYFKQDELIVIWDKTNSTGHVKNSQFSFSYGLPRQDVEAALNHGP